MADADGMQLALMKLLAMKHFPLRGPRPSVDLPKLITALKRLGTDTDLEEIFAVLNNLKGRGIANTDPKIIDRDEMTTAKFEIWLTPLGRSMRSIR